MKLAGRKPGRTYVAGLIVVISFILRLALQGAMSCLLWFALHASVSRLKHPCHRFQGTVGDEQHFFVVCFAVQHVRDRCMHLFRPRTTPMVSVARFVTDCLDFLRVPIPHLISPRWLEQM